jgi:hypothetical protein
MFSSVLILVSKQCAFLGLFSHEDIATRILHSSDFVRFESVTFLIDFQWVKPRSRFHDFVEAVQMFGRPTEFMVCLSILHSQLIYSFKEAHWTSYATLCIFSPGVYFIGLWFLWHSALKLWLPQPWINTSLRNRLLYDTVRP